jgi:hypothetical protein
MLQNAYVLTCLCFQPAKHDGNGGNSKQKGGGKETNQNKGCFQRGSPGEKGLHMFHIRYDWFLNKIWNLGLYRIVDYKIKKLTDRVGPARENHLLDGIFRGGRALLLFIGIGSAVRSTSG